MINVEIIADSINPYHSRLTTFILEYPRFVHAELMTHRVFSRNAASSRAIPIEKMIEQVKKNPAMPVWWGKNQSGMQAQEELSNDNEIERYFDALFDPFPQRKIINRQSSPCGSDDYVSHNVSDKEYAQYLWLQARDKSISAVKELSKIGLHKQIANRILETWFNIRIILSGTDFENWFALREHPDAQPEIRALAQQMLVQYNKSEPASLPAGQWHIPFGDQMDEIKLNQELTRQKSSQGVGYNLEEIKKRIAVARCARISYLNYEGKDDYEADVKLCDRLFGSIPRHLSPAEHVAESQENIVYYGNFAGWKQYRKFFLAENLSDSRVVKKYYKL
jgi:thymidylate synthase ThyX